MRASEFITEETVRGKPRADAPHHFERSHPGLVAPAGRGDMYIGRYYDFYRVSSLAGMDPKDLAEIEDINFFGNLPMYSAYTQYDRDKLKAIMTKLGMKPEDYVDFGSRETDDTNHQSIAKPFKGY